MKLSIEEMDCKRENAQDAAAADIAEVNRPIFEISRDGKLCSLASFDGSGNELVVPQEYNGRKVTGIAYDFYYKNDKYDKLKTLAKVTLPVTIKQFGENSFGAETEIVSEDPGSRYLKFESCEFKERVWGQHYYELIRNCTENDGVTFEDETIIVRCDPSKSGEYIVPDNVKAIRALAFSGCKKITKIVLPEGIEDIGQKAFRNCVKLAEINLPKSLKRLGEVGFGGYGCFAGCKSLTSLRVPMAITKITKVTLPDRPGVTLYFHLGSQAYKFAKKKYTKSAVKYYMEPGYDFSGMVKIDMLELLVEENDVAMLAAVLPFYKSGGKHIDRLIEKSSGSGSSEMTAFLLEWKNQNVDIEARERREERKIERELSADPAAPKKATAADLKKLWVVRENKDKTLTICGYKGDQQECEIPDKIGSKPVVAISGSRLMEDPHDHGYYMWMGDYHPFGRSAALSKVTIPAGVTTFEEGSFWKCENLTICAPAGCAAEAYARDNNMKFIACEVAE